MRQPRDPLKAAGERRSQGSTEDRRRVQMPRSPSEILEPARGPKPPTQRRRQPSQPESRRLGSLVRFLNGALTLLVLLLLGAGAAIYYIKFEFDRAGPLGNSTVIAIPKGEGVNAVAQRLEREGAIADQRIFMIAAYVMGARNKLKAGEYEFRKGASVRQVIDTLVEGKAILQKVSVPEGKTSWQIVEILNAEENLSGEIKQIPEEGTLLPDTYKFTRGMDRNELLARMQAEMRKYLERQWPNRVKDLPFTTEAEVLIMASVVEKETGQADERDRVAGVFVNRIRKNMRLQSDPTIIYYLTGGKGKLGRGITRSELDAKHAYNSYQVSGLPPTPICNPGRAAIDAVLNPARTKDLYFVADGSGGHAFAETIRDHQANVRKWREIERQEAASKSAATPAVATAEETETIQSAGPGMALELQGVSSTEPGTAAATPAVATAPFEDGMTMDMPLPTRKPKK